MTNDLDDLASAYIDGQATDAETARIEADPELMARVGELRAIADGVARPVAPVDEMLKRRQLSAALAAFDSVGRAASEAGSGAAVLSATARSEADRPAPVEDLTQRRAARAKGRNGMPLWLGVAAALLVVAGGIGFVSQLSTGSDDETSSADVALDEAEAGEDTATDAARSAVPAEEADTSAQASTTAAVAAAELADDAASDQAEAADGESLASGDAANEPSGAGDDEGSGSTGGLFPDSAVLDEARQFYSAVPDDAELSMLQTGLVLDPSLSRCATDGVLDDGRKVTGFVPISIEGPKNGGAADTIDGEVFFVDGDSGAPVLVDAACLPLR